MKYLKYWCCFFVPLRIGCFVIGALEETNLDHIQSINLIHWKKPGYIRAKPAFLKTKPLFLRFQIILWVLLIFFDIEVMSYIKPYPNEDDENIRQRHTVMFKHYNESVINYLILGKCIPFFRRVYVFHFLRCLVLAFFGCFIIVITKYRMSLFLKGAALAEVVLLVVHDVISLLIPQHAIVGRFELSWILLSLWRLYSAAILISYALHLEDETQRRSDESAAPAEDSSQAQPTTTENQPNPVV